MRQPVRGHGLRLVVSLSLLSLSSADQNQSGFLLASSGDKTETYRNQSSATKPQDLTALHLRNESERAPLSVKKSCITDYKGMSIETPLTSFGKRIRTIIFTSLGGGLTCDNTGDWRANLPRFMGMFTKAYVIVYNQRRGQCSTCWSTRKHPVPCKEKMARGVELSVIIGTGRIESPQRHCAHGQTWCPAMHYDLKRVANSEWGVKAKRTVHFPIRNMERLMFNEVFPFDVVIDDGSFPKPIGECAAKALFGCHNKAKVRKLLYVGRMKEHKGQLSFLKLADPELLKGYTIEMFGEADDLAYVQEVERVAMQKGIQIRVHGIVNKDFLFKTACTAKGLIMVSIDKNPRAVYEAVTGGLPVFVSDAAQVSSILTNMPFAVEVSHNTTAVKFNEEFSKYMGMIQRDWSIEIRKWHKQELSNEAVYKGLCQRMGVCVDGKFRYEPWHQRQEKSRQKMTLKIMRMRPVLSVLRKNISDADIGPEVTSMSNHQKLLAKLRIWRARHGGNHNALAPSRPRSNPQHESDSSDEDDNVDDQDNDADQGFLGRSGNEYDEGVSASDNQESTTPLVVHRKDGASKPAQLTRVEQNPRILIRKLPGQSPTHEDDDAPLADNEFEWVLVNATIKQ